MNRKFRKWLACAVAVTIAVYNAPYSVEALEVIKDSVQVDSAASQEGEQSSDTFKPEDDGVQSEDGTRAEEGNSENTTNNIDSLTPVDAFKVSGIKGTDWEFKDGVLTIKGDISNKKDIRIEGDGQQTKDRVIIESGYQGTVTIENLNIDSKNKHSCAFQVQTTDDSTTKIELILEGENILKSGSDNPGLKFNGKGNGSLLTIKGNGKLTAIGGHSGSGIGGGSTESGSNITIIEGTVTAIGGNSGSGIGGGSNRLGSNGFGSNIKIIGGTVIAKGGSNGSGIGGGYNGFGSNITIAGGIVIATGLHYGSGIGGGYNKSGSNITITGGTVVATGGDNGSGIGGGGDNGSGSNITIVGGSVNASSISVTPKYENEDVYLVKLDNQGDFKQEDTVKVVGQTGSGKKIDKNYNVASNHPGDDSFYLYMPAGKYTITTHKGIYRVNVTDKGSFITETPNPKDMVVTNTKDGILVDVSNYPSEYGNIKCSLNGTDWVYEEIINDKRQVLLKNIDSKNENQTIYIKYKGNDSYLESVSSNKEFKIGNITIKDSMVYTGNAITETDIVESKSGNGEVTLEYAKKGGGDSWINLDNPPTDAGSYKVKATLAATNEHTSAIIEQEFKITRATNSWKEDGKLNIEDSTYGGKFNEPKAKAIFGEVKFTYSKLKNDGYTENPPTEAGIYYVKANVEGTTNYNGLESAPVQFEIAKAASSIKFKDGVDFGKIYDGKAIVVTRDNVETSGSTGNVSFKFEKKINDKFVEIKEVPVEAGTYRVTASLAEDGNYNYAISESLGFTIDKAPTTLKFVKDNIDKTYDGNQIDIPEVTKTGNSNDVKFTWFVKTENDWNELTEAPTNAGEYKVVASVEKDTNYNEISIGKEFKIEKVNSSIKFKEGTEFSKQYDGKSVNVTEQHIEKVGSTGTVSFTFKKKVNDEFVEIKGAPADVGTYQVIASLDKDNNHNSASASLEFTISKATSLIEFKKDTNFGKTYDGKAVVATRDNVETLGSTGDVSFKFEKKINDKWVKLGESEAPTNVGTYRVTAILDKDNNHNPATSKPLEFTIERADSEVNITTKSLDKVYDKDAVSDPEYTKSGSNGTVTIKWQKNTGTAENKNWKDLGTAPSEAGSYRVVVELAENDNYNSASSNLEFTISKATSTIEFKKDTNFGKQYDGKAVVVTRDNVEILGSTGDVSFTFEKKVNDKFEEITEVPKDVGTYRVTASLVEDNNHEHATSKSLEFTIEHAEIPEGPEEGGKIEITVPEWIEGNKEETQQPTVTIPEGKPEGETFTTEYYYKKYGADDNTYTTEVPTEAGKYTLKVEIKSENYKKVITKDFTIYAKAPEITEESGKVDTSTDKIEINTEITEGNKDVYFYCTESTKVPNPLVISSKFRKVDEWEKANGSKHVFTGLKPNTTYHVWKYDNAKPEGEKLTYEYSIKTDTPSIPSIPSKPEEKPGIGVEVEVVDKIAGENRYDTSVSISQKVFPSKSEKVYLVSGEKFPDALSSAALTGKGDGPILLINDKNIDKILAEIDRLDAKEIIFIGGNSISDANEAKIRKFAKENSSVVSSFVGKDRYETAVKVAEQTISKYGNKGKVIIADGRNYPDAVSIASYAAKEGIPVILVNGNKVPDVVKSFLNKYKISNAIIVGGDKAVGKDVEKLFKSVDRVAGDDRYDTSKKIAEKFFAESKTVFVASGESFADSLSVSYYTGAKNAPILLTKANYLDNDTREYLEKNKDKEYIIVGGDKAINLDLFK